MPSYFQSINIDINSKSKNNKLATRDATIDNDWWGKVPHLAPWQWAKALSDLMNYIDTQAILMTLSISPSPLSFLSLFPALGLAPASSHCSNIQSWVLSLHLCVCVCLYYTRWEYVITKLLYNLRWLCDLRASESFIDSQGQQWLMTHYKRRKI